MKDRMWIGTSITLNEIIDELDIRNINLIKLKYGVKGIIFFALIQHYEQKAAESTDEKVAEEYAERARKIKLSMGLL